jgi:hypothetical protein
MKHASPAGALLPIGVTLAGPLQVGSVDIVETMIREGLGSRSA